MWAPSLSVLVSPRGAPSSLAFSMPPPRPTRPHAPAPPLSPLANKKRHNENALAKGTPRIFLRSPHIASSTGSPGRVAATSSSTAAARAASLGGRGMEKRRCVGGDICGEGRGGGVSAEPASIARSQWKNRE